MPDSGRGRRPKILKLEPEECDSYYVWQKVNKCDGREEQKKKHQRCAELIRSCSRSKIFKTLVQKREDHSVKLVRNDPRKRRNY